MNAAQKKELKRIFGELEQLQEDAARVHVELEEAIEDKSDEWKESDAGEKAQKEIDNLEEFVNAIENVRYHAAMASEM